MMSNGVAGRVIESSGRVKNGILRLIVVALSIIFELAVILVIASVAFGATVRFLTVLVRIAAIVAALSLYSADKTSAIRMPWVLLLLIAPILGLVLYLGLGSDRRLAKTRARFERYHEKYSAPLTRFKLHQRTSALMDPHSACISRYIEEFSSCPVYCDSQIQYYSSAEAGLEAQKLALRSAKKFIFMEYYAIEDSQSWWGVRDILEQKVAEGVEVRLIYDDLGSINFVNTDFMDRVNMLGIECRAFNIFKPGLNYFLNNRDHRKITVVDGKVGFVGGYNIADEYFNINSPYGHWKDTGVRLEGNAVNNLTSQFLEMWGLVNKDGEDDDHGYFVLSGAKQQHGFIQPFGETPTDDEMMSEGVYISVANCATDYAWYVTPYLIITDELKYALTLAAKRGVDVRIITPGIPDKKVIYNITRSYYHELVKHGVRIYEYTPGFCHCKMCVSDGLRAVCGTINLDFRSLYHHFESGVFMSGSPAVGDIRRDFEWMIGQSHEVTQDYITKQPLLKRLKWLFLRLFAQLM